MTSRSSLPIRLLAFVILLSGVALAYGGAQLILASGSLYYLSGGITLCVVAVLLFLRRPLGLQLYGIFLAASLIWSVFEVGFDGWGLFARLDWWWLLALALLLPWVSGGLIRHGAPILLWAATLMTTATGAFAFGLETLVSDTAFAKKATAPVSEGATGDISDGVLPADWPAPGRTHAGTGHSPLTRITTANAHQLTPAWSHDLGTASTSGHSDHPGSAASPVKIGNTLYLCTQHSQVIALNAATGKQRWRYRPHSAVATQSNQHAHAACHGVGYLDSDTSTTSHAEAAVSPAPASGAACVRRILAPIDNRRLIALDADTGQLCPQFGDQGGIDLTAGSGAHHPPAAVVTGPPTVTHGLVILHLLVDDSADDKAAHVIRAYDAHTGRPVWHFTVGRRGGVSSIATPDSLPAMSVDSDLGLVYVVLGQEPPGAWAGNRSPSAEQFATSVVALDVDSGDLVWRYQAVHHDLWGQNLSAQPVLTELEIHHGRQPVLILPTRNGDLFVLDRRTGRPVLPAPETRVPQGSDEGRFVAPSQPFSRLNLRPSRLHGHDMWGLTPFDQLACRVSFKRARYEGLFTPPSTQGTIVYPGGLSGGHWSDISVDARRQTLFAASDRIASYAHLIPRDGNRSGKTAGSGEHPVASASLRLAIHPFVSPLSLPCQAPPWGHVTAIDLGNSQTLWRQDNGDAASTAQATLSRSMNKAHPGGLTSTASGVMFMAGTRAHDIRAYAENDGRLLWKHQLPGTQQTRPVIYSVDGREYVVVVSAGHQPGAATTDGTVTAYALPRTVDPQQSEAAP